MNNHTQTIISRLKEAQKLGKFPREVNISIYEDDEALRRFRPLEDWAGGAREHYIEMLKIQAAIKEEFPNLNVKLKEIKTAEYYEWLNRCGIVDSDNARATYVTLD